MRYWTISYPGDHGQHCQETFSEDQIISSYYPYWTDKMLLVNKQDMISEINCIEDWKVIHWAIETDEYGGKL